MELKFHDLEKVFDILISNLKKSNINEIELIEDYYWNLIDRENIYENPRTRMGSLYDDWNCLKKILAESWACTYDLERFANIMIFFSKQVKLNYKNNTNSQNNYKITINEFNKVFKILIKKTIKYNGLL